MLIVVIGLLKVNMFMSLKVEQEAIHLSHLKEKLRMMSWVILKE